MGSKTPAKQKSVAGNMNFRNINKTIAMKHQKAESFALNIYTNDIQTGSKKIVPDISIFCNQNMFNSNENVLETNYLRFNNTELLPNLLFIHDSALFQIRRIFVLDRKYVLLGQKFEVIGFDSFLNCVQIRCNEAEEPIFVDINQLSKVKTFEIKNTVDSKQYVIAATIDLSKTVFWK